MSPAVKGSKIMASPMRMRTATADSAMAGDVAVAVRAGFVLFVGNTRNTTVVWVHIMGIPGCLDYPGMTNLTRFRSGTWMSRLPGYD